MKEEFSKGVESFRKKNQTEILEIKSAWSQMKSTGEIHPSRLEQVEQNFRDQRQNRY
jgi:hypothetical protein